MRKELLYATNNPGKVIEVSKLLNHLGVQVVSPKDLGIDLDVVENGSTLEENASLKVKAYLAVVGDRIVLADDTGLEIDALDGEPGIHVRRWKDGQTRMTDEEIIEYCLDRLNGVQQDKRGAQFRTVLVLGTMDNNLEIYDGTLRGTILEQPAPFRIEGFPFESLFFATEYGKLLGEIHKMTAEEKGDLLNHRERALKKAVERIREIFNTSNLFE